jgi:hypothetical protein
LTVRAQRASNWFEPSARTSSRGPHECIGRRLCTGYVNETKILKEYPAAERDPAAHGCRLLAATIAQAHSLDEVVVMAPLPWIETPEEEVAWAVAFGLDREIGGLVTGTLEWGWVGGWSKSIREWLSSW